MCISIHFRKMHICGVLHCIQPHLPVRSFLLTLLWLQWKLLKFVFRHNLDMQTLCGRLYLKCLEKKASGRKCLLILIFIQVLDVEYFFLMSVAKTIVALVVILFDLCISRQRTLRNLLNWLLIPHAPQIHLCEYLCAEFCWITLVSSSSSQRYSATFWLYSQRCLSHWHVRVI